MCRPACACERGYPDHQRSTAGGHLLAERTCGDAPGHAGQYTGAAEGVSLSLLKEKTGTTYIKKGDTQVLTVAADKATFPMRAGYFYTKGSALAAGTVAASITITAAYE